jgi:hypothetical protein
MEEREEKIMKGIMEGQSGLRNKRGEHSEDWDPRTESKKKGEEGDKYSYSRMSYTFEERDGGVERTRREIGSGRANSRGWEGGGVNYVAVIPGNMQTPVTLLLCLDSSRVGSLKE